MEGDKHSSTAATSTAILDACDVGTATSAAATDTVAAYQEEGEGEEQEPEEN